MKRSLRASRRETNMVEDIMLVPLIDILTILVVFLIASYSLSDFTPSDKLKLPISTSDKAFDTALKVTISKEEISVDDKAVVPINNGHISKEFKDSLLIEPLFDELKVHADRREKMFANNPELVKKFREKVVVVADKDTPALLIDEVLFTISQLNFSKFHLLVGRKSKLDPSEAAAP